MLIKPDPGLDPQRILSRPSLFPFSYLQESTGALETIRRPSYSEGGGGESGL